jgi:hypothetical protein
VLRRWRRRTGAQRYRPSNTLRFLYVGDEFVVFDPFNSACGGPYEVLNEECASYWPIDFDLPNGGLPAQMSCPSDPRPWLPVTVRVLRPRKTVAVDGGTACEVAGRVAAPIYAYSDIGKPGVPRPNAAEMRVLQKIARSPQRGPIRFTWPGGHFVVLNQSGDACANGGPFDVINDTCAAYTPSDLDLPGKGLVICNTKG